MFALLTVWFAVGGSVLGGFFAISRVVGFSESWPLTFEDVDDPAELASRTHALEIVSDPPPLRAR